MGTWWRLAVWLVVLWPCAASAQSSLPFSFHSGATAVGSGSTMQADIYSTIHVQIEGTFVGVMLFEGKTRDAAGYVLVQCTNRTDGAKSTEADAPGYWDCPGGAYSFRVRVSEYTSGTIVVTGTATTAVSGRGGGGGGGTAGLSDVLTIDRRDGTAVGQGSAVDLGSDAANAYWTQFHDPTEGLVFTCKYLGILHNCDKGYKVIAGKRAYISDAGNVRLFDFDPNAANAYEQYKLGAKKTVATVGVPLEAQSGAVTMELVQPVSGQAKTYWGTLTDSTSDAFAFSFVADKKMEGATTMTVRLSGLSTAATPSGNIQLECAVKSTRPGVDTTTSHPTTGKQAITLAPAVQNREVSVVSPTININGTVAVGARIDGLCNVNATNTTSTQLANFFLYGQAQVSWAQSSLSN